MDYSYLYAQELITHNKRLYQIVYLTKIIYEHIIDKLLKYYKF